MSGWERFFNESAHKEGQSLPEYVVLDLETTGLSCFEDHIIQVAAILYCGEKEIDTFCTYVKPPCKISFQSKKVHGISDRMVQDAPCIEEIKDTLTTFIGSRMITGYNIHFDLRFLSTAFGDSFGNACEVRDILELARKSLPELTSYKLEQIAPMVGYHGRSHDALSDCRAAAAVLHALHHGKNVTLCMPTDENVDASTNPIVYDAGHPLYQKIIVFTGDLSISRSEASDMATSVGAIVKPGVTQKTNYLVVGEQDISLVGEDGMSGKEEKAEKLNASGKAQIKTIEEAEFLAFFSHVGATV